jgi:DNA-binding NarL/FixJ family response regulator
MPIARILLVDDFVPWHAVVKSLLKANPALQVIGTATSGMQAVMMARGLQPDVVLLDIDLPGMSGTESAPHILRISPKSKLVFLTVNDSASGPRSGPKSRSALLCAQVRCRTPTVACARGSTQAKTCVD